MGEKDEGIFAYYSTSKEGYYSRPSSDLTRGAIEFTGEGFRIGLTNKFLKKGRFITVYNNYSFDVLTNKDNLENMEKLLSENNLPFDKGLSRQGYELINKGKDWEFSELLTNLHKPPINGPW